MYATTEQEDTVERERGVIGEGVCDDRTRGHSRGGEGGYRRGYILYMRRQNKWTPSERYVPTETINLQKVVGPTL